MSGVTVAIGAVLSVLGLGSYLGSGQILAALVPSMFGIGLLTAGLMARFERWHAAGMYASVVIAVFGAAAALSRALPGIARAGGSGLSGATSVQLAMGLMLSVFVVFCMNSFIAERKAQRARIGNIWDEMR
ncbi:MAG: hypothetical protein AAF219_05440 [Myxococcota bacterium]